MRYRIWDTLLKTFRERDFYLTDTGNLVPKADTSLLLSGDGTLKIQRGTGLIDKNGIHIFEGDVVKPNRDNVIYVLSVDAVEFPKATIEYFNEGFFLLGTEHGPLPLSQFAHCDCCPCALEVVGHKYE